MEILSPNLNFEKFTVEKIEYDGVLTSTANHPADIYRINCPYKVSKGDILRKDDNK